MPVIIGNSTVLAYPCGIRRVAGIAVAISGAFCFLQRTTVMKENRARCFGDLKPRLKAFRFTLLRFMLTSSDARVRISNGS